MKIQAFISKFFCEEQIQVKNKNKYYHVKIKTKIY